ncbi:hypothetical protein C8R45DRAFT_1099019 [Mycena sanguinolenta]|nr:hypothetical protein C8R45DRAFT_1099019 [Mycena sanguinolenta]
MFSIATLASEYIIAAAIDLTLKARTIGKLGDSACGSPLLPTLLCAERVVCVGAGSYVFTIATASFIAGSSGRRRAATTVVPVVFAAIALWFTSVAYTALFGTHHEIPCILSDGTKLQPEDISFALLEFPLSTLSVTEVVPDLYISRSYWLIASGDFRAARRYHSRR